MNKFQKLAQLNQDIELLENAGKFRAAEVLQRKFLREAQEYQVKPARELMNEIFLTAQNPTNEYNDLIAAYNTNLGSYSTEEQAYIAKAIERANKQRSLGTFSTSVQPNNPTVPAYSTAPANPQSTVNQVPNFGLPAQTSYDFENTSKNYNPSTYTGAIPNGLQNTDPTAPIGDFSDQVKREIADNFHQQLGNLLTNAKENMDVPAKLRMTAQENQAENQLYSSTINEIKKLLATGTQYQRDDARKLYQDTRAKFKNLKRQYLFDQQYQAIERNPNKKQ
jgi:hypothetical protein